MARDSVPLDDWVGRIHLGDCLEIMRQMPPESVKTVVTSPPYNIKQSTGHGFERPPGGWWKRPRLVDGYDSHDDAMPHGEYVEWQRECLSAMLRLLRSDGVIFYNHKWRVQGGVHQDRHDIIQGFPVRQVVIWERSGGINFNPGYFMPNYEVIYLIAKPDFVIAEGREWGCVWRMHHALKNLHPAAFPLELPDRCIRAAGEGVVLDPFMGSGTTALAAISNDQDWIGIEKSANYIGDAEARIEQWHKGQQRRLPLKSSATVIPANAIADGGLFT